jgi:hypothetical protein
MRTKNEACPKCRARGADRRGDNLVRYRDGGAHCFACGHHEWPSGLSVPKVKEQHGSESETGPLPRDFTRDIPAVAWRWLLQYGLPYNYWKPFTGFTPSGSRLVITHGDPIEVAVGRYVGNEGQEEIRRELGLEMGGPTRCVTPVLPGSVREGMGEGVGHELRMWTGGSERLQLQRQPAKWRMWGDRLRSAYVLEGPEGCPDEVILTEDIVSAHKVRAAGFHTLPLFGTQLSPKVIATLRGRRAPTGLWLDADQWGVLAPKLNRLQVFLDGPVRFIKTDKDPKAYSLEEIKEIANGH